MSIKCFQRGEKIVTNSHQKNYFHVGEIFQQIQCKKIVAENFNKFTLKKCFHCWGEKFQTNSL